jgi:hypothetical protein
LTLFFSRFPRPHREGYLQVRAHYTLTINLHPSLSGLIQQKNELIKGLVQNGVMNFKVLDVGCVTEGATTASLSEKLVDLKKVSAKDGVHFTAHGYQNLARRSVNCLQNLKAEKPQTVRKSTFFWRGFRSVHGAVTANATRSADAWRGGAGFTRGGSMAGSRGTPGGRRSRSHMFHPYRRWLSVNSNIIKQ